MRKKALHGTIACGDCGTEVEKAGPTQKFCRPCSEKRDLARKKRYHLKQGKENYEKRRTQFGEKGVELNLAERKCLHTSAPAMPSMQWYKRVGIPFSWAGSKNHIWANTARGHVFMRAESSYMRHLLRSAIAEAVADVRPAQNKIWIDIYVQKPKMNGDAVNFVDMVCDAAKDALLIDDRWFSIRSVDWQIVKKDPMLFVGVGQEDTTNVQACSSCGRLLTFDNFQRNRGLPNGIGRNCRDCQATTKQSKKRENARRILCEELIAQQIEGIFG